MKRAIVSIGVDRTGLLPTLRAASVGARKMDDWARGQGFDRTLITDSLGQPVTVAAISEAIRIIVDARVYDQLIVFFSGHGFLKGPDFEIWLLSGAPGNPNEAVNVPGSISLARNCGIPHIAFISDACRSLTTSMSMMHVSGSVIFPSLSTRGPRPEVDLFYATLPGDPAMEVPPDRAVSEYRGIFTDCLLTGLSGEVAEVKRRLKSPQGVRLLVPSRPLKKYLEVAVPDALSAVSIKLQQDPEIRVESELPNYLAEFAMTGAGQPPEDGIGPIDIVDDPNGPPPTGPDSIAHIVNYFGHEHFGFAGRWSASWEGRHFEPYGNAPVGPQAQQFEAQMGRISEAHGRESFEAQTGFTVIGESVIDAKCRPGVAEVFWENGGSHVRVDPYPLLEFELNRGRPMAISTLIIFGNGRSVCLDAIPEFIATILVEEGRVVSVNYTPSRNTERYGEYREVEEELRRRRAFAAAAARNGLFRLGPSELGDVAKYLRMLKSADPALGIYAAYAYARAGDTDGVKSVYRYMEEDLGPLAVPYDVAMLAIQAGVAAPDWPFVPWHARRRVPMLTQGWAFKQMLGFRSAWERVASGYLIPSLWTTFAKEGTWPIRELY